MLVGCYVVLFVILVVNIMSSTSHSVNLVFLSLVGIVAVTIAFMLHATESDRIKARQSDQTLDLASKTVVFMRQGLNLKSAQAVCDLLMPAVSSNAVAVTDCEKILGYAGAGRSSHLPNTPIQTQTTHQTLKDGKTRLVGTGTGDSPDPSMGELHAGIVTPLVVNGHIVGALKFYYFRPTQLDETQRAMAEGFAQLLSTQLSLAYLQQQTELATRMELKALQAQINPHFLFNTINTIAAATRTDPAKARTMLREFATYYRRLLENSDDLIELSKEIEQTERYLMFQRARFGEDQFELRVTLEDGLENLLVPAFIIQPLVENAVGHGRREEGVLHIDVVGLRRARTVELSVTDDGVGIEPERLGNLVEGGSKTGMGIALKNVNMRLKAYFGASSTLHIDSKLGVGTRVTMTLVDALKPRDDFDEFADDDILVVDEEPPVVQLESGGQVLDEADIIQMLESDNLLERE